MSDDKNQPESNPFLPRNNYWDNLLKKVQDAAKQRNPAPNGPRQARRHPPRHDPAGHLRGDFRRGLRRHGRRVAGASPGLEPGPCPEAPPGAFQDCTALKEFRIAKNRLRYLQHALFSGCKRLEHIELTGDIREIRTEAFRWTGLKSCRVLDQSNLFNDDRRHDNPPRESTVTEPTVLRYREWDFMKKRTVSGGRVTFAPVPGSDADETP